MAEFYSATVRLSDRFCSPVLLRDSQIVDIFSRKIVGWEVHEREAADLAATLIQKAVWAEACVSRPLVLHADNGSPPLMHAAHALPGNE